MTPGRNRRSPRKASARPAGARRRSLTEVPAAVGRLRAPSGRRSLLSVLFHIYSANPKDRMVGINDRELREGDSVEPGLVLEQITADGMILTYKGYRFLRGSR
jgi:general secretion pathway protein B